MWARWRALLGPIALFPCRSGPLEGALGPDCHVSLLFWPAGGCSWARLPCFPAILARWRVLLGRGGCGSAGLRRATSIGLSSPAGRRRGYLTVTSFKNGVWPYIGPAAVGLIKRPPTAGAETANRQIRVQPLFGIRIFLIFVTIIDRNENNYCYIRISF